MIYCSSLFIYMSTKCEELLEEFCFSIHMCLVSKKKILKTLRSMIIVIMNLRTQFYYFFFSIKIFFFLDQMCFMQGWFIRCNYLSIWCNLSQMMKNQSQIVAADKSFDSGLTSLTENL